jgi:hypothetical protein
MLYRGISGMPLSAYKKAVPIAIPGDAGIPVIVFIYTYRILQKRECLQGEGKAVFFKYGYCMILRRLGKFSGRHILAFILDHKPGGMYFPDNMLKIQAHYKV